MRQVQLEIDLTSTFMLPHRDREAARAAEATLTFQRAAGGAVCSLHLSFAEDVYVLQKAGSAGYYITTSFDYSYEQPPGYK